MAQPWVGGGGGGGGLFWGGGGGGGGGGRSQCDKYFFLIVVLVLIWTYLMSQEPISFPSLRTLHIANLGILRTLNLEI